MSGTPTLAGALRQAQSQGQSHGLTRLDAQRLLLYVMEGDLGDVLQALAHAREAEQLAELEAGSV